MIGLFSIRPLAEEFLQTLGSPQQIIGFPVPGIAFPRALIGGREGFIFLTIKLMKFTYYIIKHIIPEWAFLYLNYSALKRYFSVSGQLKQLLLLAKKTKPTQEYQDIKKAVLQMTYLMSKIESDNLEFQAMLSQNVDKILDFMKWKYQDLKGKTYRVSIQIQTMRKFGEELEEMHRKYKLFREKSKQKDRVFENLLLDEQIKYDEMKKFCEEYERNRKILQMTCFKLYNEGVYFEKYILVNAEGLRKIQKKYQKRMLKSVKAKSKSEFQQSKRKIEEMKTNETVIKVKQLMFQLEKMLIANYYQNNPKVCRNNLRKYQLKVQDKQKSWFLFGMFTGFCLMFTIVLIFIALDGHLELVQKKENFFYFFFPSCRGIILLIIYYWSLAYLVWQWNKWKINYTQIFEFNHHFSTLNEILQRVMLLTAYFLLILLVYIGQEAELGKFVQDIQIFNPYYLPVILWVTLILLMACPFKQIFNYEGRLWLYRNMLYIFKLSEIGHQQFSQKHLFIFKQFTSLTIPFTDLNYTVCEFFHQFEQENDTNYECFIQSRYVTLIIAMFPYIIMTYLTIIILLKKKLSSRYIMELVHNVLSIILIVLSILAYSHNILSYAWAIFALVCIANLVLIAYLDLDYLCDKIYDQQKSFFRKSLLLKGSNRKRILLALYVPLAICYPLSISSILIGIYFEQEQHGLSILLLGCVEVLRRLFVNFYTIDKEHTINMSNYSTVGNYQYPFLEQTSKIRRTLIQADDEDSLYSKPADSSERNSLPSSQPDVVQQSVIENRNNLGVQSLPESIQSNLFQSFRKANNLTEIVKKDSEKALGDSFYDFDLEKYKKESEEHMRRFLKPYLEESQLERVVETNKLYKLEINRLQVKYEIKRP